MTNQINWYVDLSPCEYPYQVRNIYYRNYISQRKSFTKWIDNLNRDFHDDIDWWLSFPSSRNPNYSNLFHFICIIETFYHDNGHRIPS